MIPVPPPSTTSNRMLRAREQSKVSECIFNYNLVKLIDEEED